MRFLRSLCFFSLGLGLLAATGSAQEIIHALTGTVRSISSPDKSFVIFQDSSHQKTFKGSENAKARAALHKKLGEETISVSELKTEGAYVIVFYYGSDDEPTAVALKDLGKGPFTAASGTVTKFDPHTRSVTLQDETGAVQTFKISGDTVVEGAMGVADGLKFSPGKGDRLSVVAAKADTGDTALFLHQN
jgi:hypothetical protein